MNSTTRARAWVVTEDEHGRATVTASSDTVALFRSMADAYEEARDQHRRWRIGLVAISACVAAAAIFLGYPALVHLLADK
ncbi:hypothetical protein [Streptacidiphilus sp. MAP12-16]|uniref:hypothetical protein n=1 Tax=Streptacidiphilus sp. MAP12-16 TaxID=3156300 RepID=UPI003511AA60